MKREQKFKTIEVEVYKCERCDGDPWVQRPIVKNGKIKLVRPRNCTHCKSPSWDTPRPL